MFRAMKYAPAGRAIPIAALTALAATSPGLRAQTPAPAQVAAPASADQAAYTLGLNLGRQLRQDGVKNEISPKRVAEGLKDGLAGKQPLPAEQQQLQAFLRSLRETLPAQNAAAAKMFLERNARESGVTTTASGLQYRIISPGDAQAPSPQPTDWVTVEYRGTYIDGTEFDSSSRHAGSSPLAVNNTIKGWQEALALMKPGARWKLWIPPELGYGMGARPNIPGGSLLIYEIELKKVVPAPQPAPRK
jgi:FKBP-type peptidyl-prolyl cis-trans isomerase FklB